MLKTFECNTCDDKLQRPIDSKCTRIVDSKSEDNNSVTSNGQSDINIQILNELKSLSGRMSAKEKWVKKVENPEVTAPSSESAASAKATVEKVTPMVLSRHWMFSEGQTPYRPEWMTGYGSCRPCTPNVSSDLKGGPGGLNENFCCKREVPFPQNHIFSGTSKQRVTYDSLSMAQWVSGFCSIIKEENDVKLKNHMLSYAADLMEDCDDFGSQRQPKGHTQLYYVKWRKAKLTRRNPISWTVFMLREIKIIRVQHLVGENKKTRYPMYLFWVLCRFSTLYRSRRVVGRAEETSTYSSSGFCTVNCQPTASNYRLSYLRPRRDQTTASEVGGESVTTLSQWPQVPHVGSTKKVLVARKMNMKMEGDCMSVNFAFLREKTILPLVKIAERQKMRKVKK